MSRSDRMTRDVRSFRTTRILSVSILAMMGPLPAYARCVAGCGSLELGGLGTLQGSLDSSSSVRMFRGARFAEPWQRFERAQLVRLWPGSHHQHTPSPSTHTPTTPTPTTALPSTVVPTTPAPTTLAPTTKAPMTATPSTGSPTHSKVTPGPTKGPTLPPGPKTHQPTLLPGSTQPALPLPTPPSTDHTL